MHSREVATTQSGYTSISGKPQSTITLTEERHKQHLIWLKKNKKSRAKVEFENNCHCSY